MVSVVIWFIDYPFQTFIDIYYLWNRLLAQKNKNWFFLLLPKSTIWHNSKTNVLALLNRLSNCNIVDQHISEIGFRSDFSFRSKLLILISFYTWNAYCAIKIWCIVWAHANPFDPFWFIVAAGLKHMAVIEIRTSWSWNINKKRSVSNTICKVGGFLLMIHSFKRMKDITGSKTVISFSWIYIFNSFVSLWKTRREDRVLSRADTYVVARVDSQPFNN